MNFIIDAHLPQSLANYFPGHNVIHTLSLSEGNFTSDQKINEISMADERVLITKDSDFYYSFLASRRPYKLVLVKLGNYRLKEIKTYFENNALALVELLQINSFIILEPGKMRVLQ